MHPNIQHFSPDASVQYILLSSWDIEQAEQMAVRCNATLQECGIESIMPLEKWQFIVNWLGIVSNRVAPLPYISDDCDAAIDRWRELRTYSKYPFR